MWVLKERGPVISLETYEAVTWNLEIAFGTESLFNTSTYHRTAHGQGGERR